MDIVKKKLLKYSKDTITTEAEQFHGIHWNPCGIMMDSIWNCPFHDNSTWNP